MIDPQRTSTYKKPFTQEGNYLVNQGGTAAPFHSRIACHIFNLADKYGITLIPAYIPTPQCGGGLLIEGKFGSKMALLPDIVQVGWQPLVNYKWICWHPHVSISVCIITSWKIHYLWEPWVECFKPSSQISGELSISSSCISSHNSVKVSWKTYYRSIQTLFLSAHTWMEAPWVLRLLNMLEGISHQFPIIKYLIKDVLEGLVFKGLQ